MRNKDIQNYRFYKFFPLLFKRSPLFPPFFYAFMQPGCISTRSVSDKIARRDQIKARRDQIKTRRDQIKTPWDQIKARWDQI